MLMCDEKAFREVLTTDGMWIAVGMDDPQVKIMSQWYHCVRHPPRLVRVDSGYPGGKAPPSFRAEAIRDGYNGEPIILL